MKHLSPKARLGLTVGLVMLLSILLGSLLLAFLKRPRAWEPLDPEAYNAVVLHDARAHVILFGEHAEGFVSLINDQITTRSTASTEGYNSVVTLYGDEGYTSLHFSRYYMYLALNLNGKPTFRPNDWRCGQDLVVRMKELCDSETDAQPMPTAEEVMEATLTQNGSTTPLDADQIADFCAAVKLLNSQTVTGRLSLKDDEAHWCLRLQLQRDLELQVFHHGQYVQLKFLRNGSAMHHPGRIYRLDPGSDPFAALFELLEE